MGGLGGARAVLASERLTPVTRTTNWRWCRRRSGRRRPRSGRCGPRAGGSRAAFGRHVASPSPRAPGGSRRTTVLASFITPRKTNIGSSAEGSGVRRATSLAVRMLAGARAEAQVDAEDIVARRRRRDRGAVSPGSSLERSWWAATRRLPRRSRPCPPPAKPWSDRADAGAGGRRRGRRWPTDAVADVALAVWPVSAADAAARRLHERVARAAGALAARRRGLDDGDLGAIVGRHGGLRDRAGGAGRAVGAAPAPRRRPSARGRRERRPAAGGRPATAGARRGPAGRCGRWS